MVIQRRKKALETENKIEAKPKKTRHAMAVIALIGFCLAFYWRITETLFTGMWPSDMQDGAAFTWNLWYLPHALLEGQNPFSTTDIFYPVGAALGFHTYIPLISLLSWPLVQVIGMSATFTVITLLGPISSGVATYFLTFHLVRNKWAAFFAGAAYAMLPDRVLRVAGHVNLNQTVMLPLTLLFLLKFYEKPTKRNTFALGALLGTSLLIESIFTAFLIIAVVTVALWRWKMTFTKQYLAKWIFAGITALAVASPVLVAMVRDIRNKQLDPLNGFGGADIASADLLSYFIPSQFNPVTGSWFQEVYAKVTAGERFTFVGWTVCLLATVAIFAWKQRHKWVLVSLAAVFFVLSLGPFLHVANQQGGFFQYHGIGFDIPLPYFLIHFVPILNGVRIPGRFGLFTNLLLAVIAAGGLTYLISRFSEAKRKLAAPVISLIALTLLTIECLPGSVPVVTDPKIPAAYTAIRNDPGNGAVLEVPIQWRDGFIRIGDSKANRDDTVFLYYATEHEKPLVNGMTARYPDRNEIALKDIPVYEQIISMQEDGPTVPVTFNTKDLSDLGIGYLVMHRDRYFPAVYDYIQKLNLPVLADDGTVIVWKVPTTR